MKSSFHLAPPKRERVKSGILQVNVDCFTSHNHTTQPQIPEILPEQHLSHHNDGRKLHLTIQKNHKTWIIPPLTKHKYHTMVIYGGNSAGNSSEIHRKFIGNMTGNTTVKQKRIDGKIVVSSILTRL